MQIMRAFCRVPLGVAGPVVRPSLAAPSAAPADSGRLPRPAYWADPGGREATVAAILVISAASCRGRHHTRASALARAMLSTYLLDYA
jgi:hypothetical protein